MVIIIKLNHDPCGSCGFNSQVIKYIRRDFISAAEDYN